MGMSPELLSTIWTLTTKIDLDFFVQCLRERVNDPLQVAELAGNSSLGNFLRDNPDWWSRGEMVLRWCRESGSRITFPGEADYPPGFTRLEDPPLFLSYFGTPCWHSSDLLSVVGSREPCERSLAWMERELQPLAKKGAVFVSGGARGVDQRAHAISLRTGRPTVAFLPAGLERIYPTNFMDWVKPICEAGGAVVSELAPWESMHKHYFVKRNRMIAALSRVTLIVEARRQSGTMITARCARDNDRVVGVLPGPPGDPRYAGNLELLASGAHMIRDYWDLLTLSNLNSH